MVALHIMSFPVPSPNPPHGMLSTPEYPFFTSMFFLDRSCKQCLSLPFVDGARAVRVHPPALVLGDQGHFGRSQAVALVAVH